MPKYEELNETQQGLYDNLDLKIYEGGSDIEPILKEASPDDLLNVFKAVKNAKVKNPEATGILLTILGKVVNYIRDMSELESTLVSILKVAQDKGILKEVVSMNTELTLETSVMD